MIGTEERTGGRYNVVVVVAVCKDLVGRRYISLK